MRRNVEHPELVERLSATGTEIAGRIKLDARRIGGAVCAAICLFGTLPAEATASKNVTACYNGEGIYGYAGIADAEDFNGFAAKITETAEPKMFNGHIAAWIGFGAEKLGPGGTDEWLQAGILQEAGQPQSELYYEITLPNRQPHHVLLGQVAINSPQSIRFERISAQPEEWILDVNDQRRGPVFRMPAKHKTWIADFTAESWISNEAEGAGCNIFQYKFEQMAVRQPNTNLWHIPEKPHRFKDGGPGYAIEDLTPTSFTAVDNAGG